MSLKESTKIAMKPSARDFHAALARVVYTLLGFFAVLGLTWLLLPIPAESIETLYSRGFYPINAWWLIRLTDLFPFSLVGLGLLLLPILLIFFFIRAIRLKRFSRALLWQIPLVGLAMYGLFITTWGANYRRLPIETLLQLEPEKVGAADFDRLAQSLFDTIKANADAPRDRTTAFAALRVSIAQTLEPVVGAVTLPSQVKATPTGLLMMLNTSGVVSPLTLEAHVDSALPEPFFLAVAGHELIHTTGFAGEADTDLLAAIAGLRSSSAYMRYGTALWHYARVFTDTSPNFQKNHRGKLPPVARADYAALELAREQHTVPFLAGVSQAAYNQYLQSQGVKAGVKDYSRIGRLLAAAQNKSLLP